MYWLGNKEGDEFVGLLFVHAQALSGRWIAK
jgi:hypothetical protein